MAVTFDKHVLLVDSEIGENKLHIKLALSQLRDKPIGLNLNLPSRRWGDAYSFQWIDRLVQ